MRKVGLTDLEMCLLALKFYKYITFFHLDNYDHCPWYSDIVLIHWYYKPGFFFLCFDFFFVFLWGFFVLNNKNLFSHSPESRSPWSGHQHGLVLMRNPSGLQITAILLCAHIISLGKVWREWERERQLIYYFFKLGHQTTAFQIISVWLSAHTILWSFECKYLKISSF